MGLLLVPGKGKALGFVGKRAESAVPHERQESENRFKNVDNLDEMCACTSRSFGISYSIGGILVRTGVNYG